MRIRRLAQIALGIASAQHGGCEEGGAYKGGEGAYAGSCVHDLILSGLCAGAMRRWKNGGCDERKRIFEQEGWHLEADDEGTLSYNGVVLNEMKGALPDPKLHAWIKRVMSEHQFSHEIIFVDDGSTDQSWPIIEQLSQCDSAVHGIKFRRNYGKSPALFCGFRAAKGDVVITMDADLQDSPDEIPELYRMIKEEGYDLVSGYKQKRYDPISKTIPTKLFNATARKVSGIPNLHDFNCGLKAYRLEVVKHIEVYGEMHRYIPYLAKNAGFTKIGEKVVHHQARKFGKSKFMGLNRFINGYLDLLSLWFLNSFGLKPMHVFGFLGSLMFIVGFFAVLVVGGIKFYHICCGTPAPLVTSSPYFYISLTMMVLGTQLFVAGFLGELISRNAQGRNDYHIEKEF